jgi:hypothetical protein
MDVTGKTSANIDFFFKIINGNGPKMIFTKSGEERSVEWIEVKVITERNYLQALKEQGLEIKGRHHNL